MVLTWDTEIVERHPVEVQIQRAIKKPPFERVLNYLGRMPQVLF